MADHAIRRSPVKIVLVDDHTILRESLKTLLEVDKSIMVIAQAQTAEEGLEKISLLDCDAALIDITLPGKDGMWLVRELRNQKPELPVLMLSMHVDDKTVLAALEAGANGYMPKSANYREILAAIDEICEGRSYIHSSVAASVLRGLRKKVSVESGTALPGGALTPREREILTLAAQGLNSQGIADRLFLSVSTVKTHLRGLYRKLDVSDRTQAVLVGIQRGLIDGRHLLPGGEFEP